MQIAIFAKKKNNNKKIKSKVSCEKLNIYL